MEVVLWRMYKTRRRHTSGMYLAYIAITPIEHRSRSDCPHITFSLIHYKALVMRFLLTVALGAAVVHAALPHESPLTCSSPQEVCRVVS
jgi:hypothetical protein